MSSDGSQTGIRVWALRRWTEFPGVSLENDISDVGMKGIVESPGAKTMRSVSVLNVLLVIIYY